MALGQEDFGLYGLIGSIVIFLSFFNIQFAGALSRFYAYAVGEANVSEDSKEALEECRKWFSTGVTIHTLVPVLLVCAGYPIGVWAIQSGVIGVPVVRMNACVWLWRFVSVSAFVSMVNVPFSAMYTAKQYIAELTIYSFGQTLLRTMFIYYMTLSPGDWLVKYGFATCLLAIVPQLVICFRAIVIFPECRLRWSYVARWFYVKRIGSYALWQTFGGLGYLARHQGLTVIVNRYFGPRITASFSIGGTVSAEAASLTGALQGAFAPAITTTCGEGNMRRVREMAYRTCKFGTLLTMMFAVPMALEVTELLHVWLKVVPPHAEGICLSMLGVIVVEKLTLGHIIGVNATGRVAKFQFYRGVTSMMAIPLSILMVLIWRHIYLVCLSLFVIACISCCSDVWLARARIGLSVRYWMFKILLPLSVVLIFMCAFGYLPHFMMPPSVFRMCVTTGFSLSVFLILSWLFVLDVDERAVIVSRIKTMPILKFGG